MCECGTEEQEWCLWRTDSRRGPEAGEEMCLSQAVSHAQTHRRTISRKSFLTISSIIDFYLLLRLLLLAVLWPWMVIIIVILIVVFSWCESHWFMIVNSPHKDRLISIIPSLLQSIMNCTRRWYKNFHVSLNLLLAYTHLYGSYLVQKWCKIHYSQ